MITFILAHNIGHIFLRTLCCEQVCYVCRFMGSDNDSRFLGPFSPVEPFSLLKSLLNLMERNKWRCSHLKQEWVYSLEQVEPMRLVRRHFAMAREVKRVTGVDWS